MSIDLRFPLKGIIPPVVTPLRDHDALDEGGLERLLAHLLDGGVHGLFLLGTTGEGPALSQRLRCAMIDRTMRQAGGQLPVLVGVSDTSYIEALRMAQFAADAGADAVVIAAPSYFPATQKELRRYIARAAAESPLPVILYNMPSHTKLHFEIETVQFALEQPNVIGIKDSSAQMLYFQQLLQLARQQPDFCVFMGPEELTGQAVLLGADGGVCGGANLAPAAYVALYDAALSRDVEALLACQDEVLALAAAVYTLGEKPSSYLTGLKAALDVCGICSGVLTEPFEPLPTAARETLRSRLNDLSGRFPHLTSLAVG